MVFTRQAWLVQPGDRTVAVVVDGKKDRKITVGEDITQCIGCTQ
jgi:hypothetical protein